MVGQSHSLVTPSHNLVYEEDGLRCFLTDLGYGDLSFHVDIKGKITKSRLIHFGDIFGKILLGLMDRDVPDLRTWIEAGNEVQERFAEFYGFEYTGMYRNIVYDDGSVKSYHEMVFPLSDEEN